MEWALAMRTTLLVLVAGCWAPTSHDTAVPDAACGDIGAFEIAAPRPELHYAPSLDVYVDEIELWAELTLVITDELGAPYAWTSDSSEPYPSGAGMWWRRDGFHYDLAASHRYTLTVSHCTTRQSVEFFTSP